MSGKDTEKKQTASQPIGKTIPCLLVIREGKVAGRRRAPKSFTTCRLRGTRDNRPVLLGRKVEKTYFCAT